MLVRTTEMRQEEEEEERQEEEQQEMQQRQEAEQQGHGEQLQRLISGQVKGKPPPRVARRIAARSRIVFVVLACARCRHGRTGGPGADRDEHGECGGH